MPNNKYTDFKKKIVGEYNFGNKSFYSLERNINN